MKHREVTKHVCRNVRAVAVYDKEDDGNDLYVSRNPIWWVSQYRICGWNETRCLTDYGNAVDNPRLNDEQYRARVTPRRGGTVHLLHEACVRPARGRCQSVLCCLHACVTSRRRPNTLPREDVLTGGCHNHVGAGDFRRGKWIPR